MIWLSPSEIGQFDQHRQHLIDFLKFADQKARDAICDKLAEMAIDDDWAANFIAHIATVFIADHCDISLMSNDSAE